MNKDFNKKEYLKKESGFTLVEALVAISLLMVAVVSPITLSQKSLATAVLNKDQMTASFLAQDAIEFIKNKRDAVGLTHDPEQPSEDWLSGLEDCFSPNYCNIDTTTAVGVIEADLKPLEISTDTDGLVRYSLSGEAQSKFVRKITIKKPAVLNGDTNEALITVEVIWSSNLGTQSIIIEDFIYNYWENL